VVRVSGSRSRGPGFDSRPYQIFWEVGGLEWGPLSLVRTIEELLEWKSSGSGSRKTDINGRGNSLRWPRNTLYPQKLALTSPTSGGRLVGIVRLGTKATEYSIYSICTSLAVLYSHQEGRSHTQYQNHGHLLHGERIRINVKFVRAGDNMFSIRILDMRE
jgi:hypothetical protein